MTRFLAALALVAAWSSAAHADPRAFRIGARPVWFVMGGVTGGGTVATDDKGGFVGGELSVSRLRQGSYLGVYADAYRDFGIDGTYATAGLELGRRFFGFDAGGALRFAGEGAEPGATARIYATVSVFSVFVRYAYFGGDENDHVVQVGATLKIPLVSPR